MQDGGDGTLAARLMNVERFVEAATLICDEASLLGVERCAVVLYGRSGLSVLVIDNDLRIPDERRLRAVGHRLANGISLFEGPHTIMARVIGPSGWFATIHYGTAEPCTPSLERELWQLATHLSVWCAIRNVGLVSDRPIFSPQQHRIAQLAARGLFNVEIADELGISVNTVKLRLKQVFERIGVDNRVELANVLRKLAPADEVPEGVTHLSTVTVTRALASLGQGRARSRRRGR